MTFVNAKIHIFADTGKFLGNKLRYFCIFLPEVVQNGRDSRKIDRDCKHVYRGRSSYSSDILYSFDGALPLPILMMIIQ